MRIYTKHMVPLTVIEGRVPVNLSISVFFLQIIRLPFKYEGEGRERSSILGV
jgi:hypothetical protein